MFAFVICDPIAGGGAGCPQCGGGRNVLTVLSAGVGPVGAQNIRKHWHALNADWATWPGLGHNISLCHSVGSQQQSTRCRPNIHYSLTIWTLYICQCKIEEAKESASEDYSLSCIELLTLLIWNVRLMFNKFNSSLSCSPRLYFNSASTLYYRKACYWEVLLVGYITI